MIQHVTTINQARQLIRAEMLLAQATGATDAEVEAILQPFLRTDGRAQDRRIGLKRSAYRYLLRDAEYLWPIERLGGEA